MTETVNLPEMDVHFPEEAVPDEIDALDPLPTRVTLSSGLEVDFEQLKTRQFFRLLRIITKGAGPALSDPELYTLSPGAKAEEWGQKILALLFLSIPDAEDEAVAFISSMVRPVGLADPRKPGGFTKPERANNDRLWREFSDTMANPSIEDTYTVIEGVIRREADDLVALGRKLMKTIQMGRKANKLPVASPTSQDSNSSEDSADPMISWPPSTDGPTTS